MNELLFLMLLVALSGLFVAVIFSALLMLVF